MLNPKDGYTYVTTEKEKEILRTRHPRNKINIGEDFDNVKIDCIKEMGKL